MPTDHPNILNDVDSACARAAAAGWGWLDLPAAERAGLLHALADALDARRDQIIATCADETSLTPSELAPEASRMTGTIRLYADVAREGSWVRAAIDTPDAPNPVGPPNDTRSMLRPLQGAVAVFGASNFPLAYGVCGGDTASALAAGCAVIVKEHPAHPRTGRLILAAAADALRAARPDAADMLLYVTHEDPADFSVARRLVSHQAVAAVGFTGSVAGGLAVEQIARSRPWPLHPIPVFGELGSLNPVFIGPAAARSRGVQIADHLCDAILLRHGQQCTKPGIILVPDDPDAWEPIAGRFTARFRLAPPRRMLAPWVRDNYLRRLHEALDAPGVRCLVPGHAAAPGNAIGATLLACDFPTPWAATALHDEIFGPACLLVRVPAAMLPAGVPALINASLTATFYADDDDMPASDSRRPLHFRQWLPQAGRIIINAVPTGVRVAHSMVHGGPFPSSTRPDTTAVGPASMLRWCRPACYQNCPDNALPPELQNANPLRIARTVNGQPTRDAIKPAPRST